MISKQPGVSMETQDMIWDLMAVIQFATQTVAPFPGLLLTTAPGLPSTGSRFSTDADAVDIGLEKSMSAFQTIFQPLAARYSLVAPSLAILLDLLLMGKTYPLKVKSYNKIAITDKYHRSREVRQICHCPDG